MTSYIVVLQLLWLGAFYCKSQTDDVQKILKENTHSETFTWQDAAHIQDHFQAKTTKGFTSLGKSAKSRPLRCNPVMQYVTTLRVHVWITCTCFIKLKKHFRFLWGLRRMTVQVGMVNRLVYGIASFNNIHTYINHTFSMYMDM